MNWCKKDSVRSEALRAEHRETFKKRLSLSWVESQRVITGWPRLVRHYRSSPGRARSGPAPETVHLGRGAAQLGAFRVETQISVACFDFSPSRQPHHGNEFHPLKKRIISPCLRFNYPTLAQLSWVCGRGMCRGVWALLFLPLGHFGSARPHMVPAVSSSPTNLSVLELIWLMEGQLGTSWGVGLRSLERTMDQ